MMFSFQDRLEAVQCQLKLGLSKIDSEHCCKRIEESRTDMNQLKKVLLQIMEANSPQLFLVLFASSLSTLSLLYFCQLSITTCLWGEAAGILITALCEIFSIILLSERFQAIFDLLDNVQDILDDKVNVGLENSKLETLVRNVSIFIDIPLQFTQSLILAEWYFKRHCENEGIHDCIKVFQDQQKAFLMVKKYFWLVASLKTYPYLVHEWNNHLPCDYDPI